MSTPSTTTPFSAVLCVILAIVLWSSTYVAIRIGLHGFTPGALGLLRYSIASVVMGFLYYRLPHKTRLTQTNFWQLFFTGAIGIGSYNILINYAEQYANAALTSFILCFIPMMVTAGAILIFKEKISIRSVMGIMISFAGLLLIFIIESHVSVSAGMGLLFLVGALFSGSFYNLMQRLLVGRMHPIEIVTWCIWFATAASAIYIPDLYHDLSSTSGAALSAVVYLGIFPAAIAYAGWSYAIKHIPLTKMMPSFFLIPPLTTLLGWAILGETISWPNMVGGGLIIVGSLVTFVKRG